MSPLRSALPFLVIVFVGALVGCGSSGFGSAGIGSGGVITGRVVSNASGGWSDSTAVANVHVVARQVDGSGLTRSTKTDGRGVYRFDALPLGTWRLGFSATGYAPKPVDTSWITGYSEAGRVYTVSDVYLEATASSGQGNVVVTLIHAVTGNPISNATVMVGPSSGITDWYGEVRLSVPVRIDQATGQPMAERIIVSASGIDGSTASPSHVTPVAHHPTYITVRAQGWGTIVAGHIRVTSYEQLYLSQGILASLSITSGSVPSHYLDPYIDPFTGHFSVTVPAGTSSLNLHFSNQAYFDGTTVGPIMIPEGGGVVNLSSPVYLTPRTRAVTGYVVNSSGHPASGHPAQVTVAQIGVATTPVSGSYHFGALPVGIPLTFEAVAVGPLGYLEAGSLVAVVTAGSSSPFFLPTIRTGF